MACSLRSTSEFLLVRRLQQSNFTLCSDNKTTGPFADVFRVKDLVDSFDQVFGTRQVQSDQENTVMFAGRKSPNGRIIQILRNEKSRFPLRRFPYFVIREAAKTFSVGGMHIMAETSQ